MPKVPIEAPAPNKSGGPLREEPAPNISGEPLKEGPAPPRPEDLEGDPPPNLPQ
jgi:hypothetical protein